MAESIKGIIDSYIQVGNPLEYVVIIGNDNVIPFYRYPDNALLANEMDYSPPVADNTSSQASLRLGYFLGQDGYGSHINLVQKSSIIPLPDLAVGRLVETPIEVMNMLSAYGVPSSGLLSTPASGLVTGYDFLSDAASEIKNEIQSGLGEQNPGAMESLIAEASVAPLDVCQPGSIFDGQCSWTADQVWNALLNQRHDIIFLAGHFNANSWLAADSHTRLLAEDIDSSNIDLVNTLIFSAGCHSGYNIVNEHGVPGVTLELDWAQVFARKGATFIGGTGYQYGDTDFLEYTGMTGEKKLVITGEGFHTDDYVRYLKKISQERNSIVFTGPQSGKELDQLYSNAFLFVQPSELEGLSLALLEAMGYGKAVLISNIPENREAAKEAGLVFASPDIHDLENKLAELIGNPKLAQHLGQKAKARIAKFYNCQSIADKIEKIYQEILRQKKYGKNV